MQQLPKAAAAAVLAIAATSVAMPATAQAANAPSVALTLSRVVCATNEIDVTYTWNSMRGNHFTANIGVAYATNPTMALGTEQAPNRSRTDAQTFGLLVADANAAYVFTADLTDAKGALVAGSTTTLWTSNLCPSTP